MDMRKFAAINLARRESREGFNHPITGWSASDWMTAILGELGEAANLVKKLNRHRDGVNGNVEEDSELSLAMKLGDEVADVFIYLDLFAQYHGWDLSELVTSKFNKTSAKIGYPARI